MTRQWNNRWFRWKLKMSEELALLQRAVEDILRARQMRPLSAYNSPIPSAASASSCSPVVTAASIYSGNSPPRNSTQQPYVKETLPTIVAPANSATGQSPERPTLAARMPMTRENSPEAAQPQHSDPPPPRMTPRAMVRRWLVSFMITLPPYTTLQFQQTQWVPYMRSLDWEAYEVIPLQMFIHTPMCIARWVVNPMIPQT